MSRPLSRRWRRPATGRSPSRRRSTPEPQRGSPAEPAGRRTPSGRTAHGFLNQNGGAAYFLSVDLTAVHMLHSVFGHFRRLVLYITKGSVGPRMVPVHWYVDGFQSAERRKYLVDMVFRYVSGQSTDVNSGGLRCGTPFFSFPGRTLTGRTGPGPLPFR